MRRREADGVAWFVARKAGSGPLPYRRKLGLWWTVHRAQAHLPGVLADVADTVRRVIAEIGYPTTVQGIHAALGTDYGEDLPMSAEGLRSLAEMFAEERPGRVTLRFEAPDGNPAERAVAALSIWANFYGPSSWTGHLQPEFGPDWYSESSPDIDHSADAWAAMLRELCALTGAVWGCVSLDYWDGEHTAYEKYFGIRYPDGEVAADRRPRGYYWANVLSAKHISALGGLSALRTRCAELGLSVEPVAPDARSEQGLVLVRDPAPVSGFSDTRLGAMHDLLEPVLLKHPYRWYAGPPLRLIKEPGTAYVPVPAGLDPWRPVFDDDEPLPGDDDW